MLKKLLIAFAGLIAVLLAAAAGYAAYISATWEKDYSAIEKPAITASTDPEVIKRGEYVVHALSHCSVCHVTRETTMARQPGEHPQMTGGFEWDMGPLGTLYSRNITPDKATGIGEWTDPELARAIRWGVDRNGKPLTFMMMGVPGMADEDLTAVISYLRSTAPVQKPNKPHEPGLMLKWMASKIAPEFRTPFATPKYVAAAEQPSVERGEYLARGPAFCVGCHTPLEFPAMTLGTPFSGSADPEPDKDDPTMVYRSPNLTPDPETGHITKWDEETFVKRLAKGRNLKTSKMPWEAYREMTDSDARSLYRYLRSLPPTKHYIGAPHRPKSE